MCEATLDAAEVEAIDTELDYSLSWCTDHVEAQEAARLEEIERVRMLVVARAKLTQEDGDAPGLWCRRGLTVVRPSTTRWVCRREKTRARGRLSFALP